MAKVVDTSDSRMTLRRLLRRPKYRYMAVNRIVPHLPWFVLFAMAAFFYKARIFAESGFCVAQFINIQNFWIESQRIVSVIPQIIPLIGVWTGLEIRYILLLWSLSHVLFFYILFLFVYYGLRDRRSGLLIILSQTVGITYSFFSPVFELYYGVPLLITFYAIWRLPFRFRTIYVLLILEALILLSHPMAFALFVFLLIYDFTKKTAKPFKFYFPIILVLLGVAVFKYYVMGDYETGKLDWLSNYAYSKSFFELVNPVNFKSLGLFMLRYYTEILVVFIIVIFTLAKRKQWLKIVLVAGSFLAYAFIVNSASPFSPSYYLEHLMYPFVLIVFIPLIYGFPKAGRQGLLNISILLVSALVVYRLTVIYYGSNIFVKRVAQMEQLIQSSHMKTGNKFVVSTEAVDHGYTQFNTSYPVETLLLSAIDGNDISVTIVPDKDLSYDNTIDKIRADQFIFRRGEFKPQSWLNKRYFHLDIGLYETLNDSTPNTYINYSANNIRITIESKNIYPAMDTVWIPVTITNRGKIPVYSGIKNKVFLSYFWTINNEVLNWSEIRTPLQADIKGTMKQDIKIAVPRRKGRMQLKADIIADDNWLGIYNQEDVLVY